MSRKLNKHESAAGLRLEYIMAAAWYWVKAVDLDENLEITLNRVRAKNLGRRLEALGIALPAPGEIYAYAIEHWPSHQLRQAPEAKG